MSLSCPNDYILRPLQVFIMLATVLAMGHAQPRDMKLSPDPVQPVIPADIAIQSAGEAGGTRLAVWGTTVEGGGGSVAGELVMRIVREGVPLGEPSSLVSAPAMPSRMARVVSLPDRFLVLWNDLRQGAPGLYAKVVDTNGISSPEIRFWPGTIASNGMGSVATRRGAMLFWSDSAGSTVYAWEIDTGGRGIGEPRVIGDGGLHGVSPLVFPAGMTLLDRGEKLPLLLDGSGSVVPLPGGAAIKLALPYHLGDDGVVTIVDSDTVREYRSLFDSVPFVSRRVVPEGTWTPGSAVPSRDAAGHLRLTYLNGTRLIDEYFNGFDLVSDVHVATELADGVFGPATSVGELYVQGAGGHCATRLMGGMESMRATRIGGNSYLMTATFSGSSSFSCHGFDDTYQFKRDVSYTVHPRSMSYDSVLPALPSLDPSVATLFRVGSSMGSRVDLAVGTSLVRLTAPALMRETPVPQHSPALRASHGRLMAGWLSLGIDSIVTLGWWSPSSGRFDGLAGLDMRETLGDHDPTRFGLIAETELVSTGSDIVLATAWRWQTFSKLNHRQRYTAHRATDSGWRPLLRHDGVRQDQHLAHAAVATDPDDGDLLVAFGSGAPNTVFDLSVHGFDSSSRERWSRENVSINPIIYSAIVPVAPGDFLAIPGNTLLRFIRSDTPMTTLIDPISGYSVSQHFLPLAGESFMRASSDGGTGLRIDRIGVDGTVIAHRSGLRLPPGIKGEDLFAVQHPVTHVIALLYGSPDGLRMSLVDDSLKVIRENVMISQAHAPAANPSAAFVGDSLYVLWEDYRDGVPAIYGTAVSATADRAGRDDAEGERAVAGVKEDHLSAMVQPAAVLLMLSSPASQGEVMEVFDQAGRLLMRRDLPAGARETTIATDALPSGPYIAKLRGGGPSAICRFVVVH